MRPVLLGLSALFAFGLAAPAAGASAGPPAAGLPAAGSATPDTTGRRHVTLGGWDRRVRLAAWDRSHAAGGLYYDRGVLRRWTRQMDHEYDLDLFSILPTPADDAAFYAADHGFRTSGGSITTGHFAVESELRTGAALAGPLGLDLRVVQQEDLSARRAAVELGYGVDLGRGHRLGLRHSFAEYKPDLDVELFYRLTHRALDAEVTAGRLDGINNLVNKTLVPDPVHDDTVRVWDTTPFWFTGRVSVPTGPVRWEAAGGVSPRARADVRLQSDPGAGFAYHDAFAYGGALAEAALWGDRLVVGALVTASRSATGRRTPGGQAPAADYAARQRESRLGAFALARWRSLRGEAWAIAERRTDRQDGRAFAGSTVDGPYAVDERWTWVRLRADWQPGARHGPTLGAEVAAGIRTFGDPADRDELHRQVLRFYPVRDNRRLTLRAGYRLSPQAEVVFGGSVDLDRDQGTLYDGAHVRLRALW